MCGIVGATLPLDKQNIYQSLERMRHRGNDGFGVFVNEKVSLGHARLSIIDLNPVTYPIPNEDHTVFVIVNGEFYGYEKIREELKQKGHQFKTETDAEILVHLYEEYSMRFTDYLNGEFAFLLYDVKRNLLVAGRDRFGVKPLYVAEKNKEYYFASEMKALLELGIEAKLDKESLLISSSMQYGLPNRTLLQHVYQILPGYLKVVDLHTKETKDIKYWDIDFTEGDYNEEELQQIMIDAVKTRMVSDVPVCCALSGGLDSSLVYGISNEVKKTNAVTVAIENSPFDESEIAKRTTDYYGTDLHVVTMNSEKLIQHFRDAVYMSEGVTINSHLVAKYLMSQTMNEKGYKVVLTGEGSDELFSGYPHFKKDLNIQYDNFEKENLVTRGIMNSHDPYHDFVSLFEKEIGYIPSFLKVKSSFGMKVLGLYNEAYVEDFAYSSIPNQLLSYYQKDKIQSFNRANASAYLWTKLSLANYILRTLADGTEMAHTIEGRTPFLDVRLWEKASKIPIEKKIEGTIEKKILREIGKPFVTNEVYHRTKQPFITPPMLLEQREYLYDYLPHLPSFVSKEAVTKLLNQLYKENQFEKNVVYEPVLFFLYSTMHFMKQFHVQDM